MRSPAADAPRGARAGAPPPSRPAPARASRAAGGTVTSPARRDGGPCAQYRYQTPTTSAMRRSTPPRTSSRSTRPRPPRRRSPSPSRAPYAFRLRLGRSSSTPARAEATTWMRRARMPIGDRRSASPVPVDDTSSPYGTSYPFGALSGSQTVTAYSERGPDRLRHLHRHAGLDHRRPRRCDGQHGSPVGSAWRNAPVTVMFSPERRRRGRRGDLLHDGRLERRRRVRLSGHELFT